MAMKQNHPISFIFSLALTTLVVSSCRDEDSFRGEESMEAPQVEVSASIVQGDSWGTRTEMSGLSTLSESHGHDGHTTDCTQYYSVNWEAGDKFGVVSGGVFPYTLVSDPGTITGRFTGFEVPAFPETSVWPAAYPSNGAFATTSDEGLSDGQILVGSVCPATQIYDPAGTDNPNGTFAADIYPMAAASTNGLSYEFLNLCGVLQLKIKSGTESTRILRSLYLQGNNREKIAGGIGMVYDATTGEPLASTVAEDYGYKLQHYGNMDERIIMDFGENGLEVSPDADVYVNIALLPVTFTHGFTVTLVDAKNLSMDVHKSVDDITIYRSHVKTMSSFNFVPGEMMEAANCYIASEAGYYLRPAFCMGNRLGVRLNTEDRNVDCALLWTDTDWNAITDIEYIPMADGRGMLSYCVNNDENGQPYRGNAAIALYDKDTKEIIWSWHIWMTEEPVEVITGGSCQAGSYECDLPDGTTYTYEAEETTGQLIIMDRNLGAVSANPADGWKTYGLYYQDGRKDPFIGIQESGNNDRTGVTTAQPLTDCENTNYTKIIKYWETSPFEGTVSGGTDNYGGEVFGPTWEERYPEYTWWNGAPYTNNGLYYQPVEGLTEGWVYYQGFLNLTEAIQHPMSFSCGYYDVNSRNKNPQWTNYMDPENTTYLDDVFYKGKNGSSGTHGHTGLNDYDHEAYWNRTKTIMDPCPPGWSVLGKYAQLIGKNDEITVVHSDGAYGIKSQLTGQSEVWWPAAGFRASTGKMADVGYHGSYWYFDHINADHGGHGWLFALKSGDKGKEYVFETQLSSDVMTNHASSVRCVKEKQFGTSTK